MKTWLRGLTWIGAALALAACGLFPGGAERVITGSGNVKSETRPVEDFVRVSLDGTGEVVVQEGDVATLTVEAEDNLLSLIRTEVENGTLRLGFVRTSWRDTIRPTEPIRFVITVPELQGFELSGSGSLQATSLRPEGFSVHISGAGNVTVDHLETHGLDVRIDGTGEVSLAGQATDQNVEISGSGQYQAGDLDSQTARVAISGVGDATLWVRADLDASISGSGTVNYWGDPTISQRAISGTGDINPMGVK